MYANNPSLSRVLSDDRRERLRRISQETRNRRANQRSEQRVRIRHVRHR